MINKMEYNEPLNLSIKKKPIAVVIPSSSSSSNKGDANTNGMCPIHPSRLDLTE